MKFKNSCRVTVPIDNGVKTSTSIYLNGNTAQLTLNKIGRRAVLTLKNCTTQKINFRSKQFNDIDDAISEAKSYMLCTLPYKPTKGTCVHLASNKLHRATTGVVVLNSAMSSDLRQLCALAITMTTNNINHYMICHNRISIEDKADIPNCIAVEIGFSNIAKGNYSYKFAMCNDCGSLLTPPLQCCYNCNSDAIFPFDPINLDELIELLTSNKLLISLLERNKTEDVISTIVYILQNKGE